MQSYGGREERVKRIKNEKVVSALMKLMLDWPMDFVLTQGDSAEEIKENMFKFGVNMSAKVERLREFVGLENMSLMRIVAHATDIVKAKLVHSKKANAEVVYQWLVANIHWGAMKTPEMETVQRLVTNWVGTSKDKRASDLIESAVQRWGRDNFLDWPTKIGLVVQKTDAASMVYVLEWLYADMRRQNKPDPYGTIDLKRGWLARSFGRGRM